MNTIEALQPVTSVFQLFGLSVTHFSSPKIPTPFQRILKIYSLLLIAIRITVFCYITMKFQLDMSSELNLIINKVIFDSVHFIEISILVEAFVKARQEETFMENFVEIDNTLKQHFNVDLKLSKLRKATIKQLFVWLCVVELYSCFRSFAHFINQYFPHVIIGSLSFLTASLTLFQIITWTDLIRYRLRIVHRLMTELKYDQSEQIAHSIETANGCNIATDDAHIFGQLSILCDLYKRLWMQTNQLNERFKFSMVFNIAYYFTYLVTHFYYIFLCFRNIETCEFLATDIAACIVYMLNLSMLCKAGQNVADEALQVAYAIHRNKFIRCSTKLNSFVCLKSFNHPRFFVHILLRVMWIVQANCVHASFQIRKFSFQMIHQPIKLNAFEFFDVDYTLIFKVISTWQIDWQSFKMDIW